MTNMRFPFQHLPNDLCLKALKTMEHHEIIAYSLTSKKALSLVHSLGLSLDKAQINTGRPEMNLDIGHISVAFNWKMGDNNEEMTSLDDIPINVDVEIREHGYLEEFRPVIEFTEFTWSNKGKSIGEWIKHICSIFRCEHYEAEFRIWRRRFDIQSLRNSFPKLRRALVYSFEDEPSEQDFQSARNVLKAFLPYLKDIVLHCVPLEDRLSIQHIGMTNLKEFRISHPLKLDDLLTLNSERCTIVESHLSLRDLNRFIKLWTKGSHPKLKNLSVHGRNIADWNVLMKGLQPEEERRIQAEGAEKRKEYIIQNVYGIRARIKMFDDMPAHVSFEFTVLI
ncbi:unnamed protein product [Caenorhabditis nigoni]